CYPGACGAYNTYAIRLCLTPPNSNQYQLSCGCSLNTPNPTGSQPPPILPTATPSPTPIPGAWIKLKDTSFYSFKSLTNLIPASASSYDSDDNNEFHGRVFLSESAHLPPFSLVAGEGLSEIEFIDISFSTTLNMVNS
ncbi:MAG: hypothetical protein N2049_04820, partial [Anaerolineales bacterium]|nr:hypothetical protein [Anaerolineales bacterium]